MDRDRPGLCQRHREEAERLTRITEHLLALTRLDSLPVGETSIVDLSAVGRRAVSMLLPWPTPPR